METCCIVDGWWGNNHYNVIWKYSTSACHVILAFCFYGGAACRLPKVWILQVWVDPLGATFFFREWRSWPRGFHQDCWRRCWATLWMPLSHWAWGPLLMYWRRPRHWNMLRLLQNASALAAWTLCIRLTWSVCGLVACSFHWSGQVSLAGYVPLAPIRKLIHRGRVEEL